MKKLLLALLAVSTTSTAATFAYFENQAGGRVVLTDEVCKMDGKVFEGLSRAYMYTDKGENDEGCYYIEDASVAIMWQSGREKRYPTSIFLMGEKYREAKPVKKKGPVL